MALTSWTSRRPRRKATKRQAHYRWATDPGVNCGECASMNADGSCRKVEGKVHPPFVCDLFTRRL